MTQSVLLYLFWASTVVVFYTHLGYPLLVSLLARLVPEPVIPQSVPDDQLPQITLIIPAYNEEVVLEAKLQNSLEIDYPPQRLEILVASDGSRDRTNEIALGFADRGVQLLAFETNRGKSSALNDTVAQARGEVLCLCDANVMFQRDALRVLVNHLSDPRVGAVTGDVRLQNGKSEFGAGESLYYRIERSLQINESLLGSTMGVDGGMYVIRRDLFRPLPPDTLLDDFKTSMNVIKAGRRLIYVPSAIAIENGTAHLGDEFRRRIRVAAGAVQSLRRGDFPSPWRIRDFFAWISHKFLRWSGPVWLLLQAGSCALLWDQGGFYQAALGCHLVLYALAALAWLVPAVREYRFCKVALYFVLSHLALAWGLVKGTLFVQSGRWQRTARTPLDVGQHAAVANKT